MDSSAQLTPRVMKAERLHLFTLDSEDGTSITTSPEVPSEASDIIQQTISEVVSQYAILGVRYYTADDTR